MGDNPNFEELVIYINVLRELFSKPRKKKDITELGLWGELLLIYNSNKNLFTQDFKKISYVELFPNNLTGQKEYSEAYFKKIDEIENGVLDGIKMNDFVKEYSLSLKIIESVNVLKKDKKGNDLTDVGKELFNKIYSIKDTNKLELINVSNKYYLSEVLNIEKISRGLEDKKIKEAIVSQLKTKHIIENNTKIVKDMSEGVFNKEKFQKFSDDNNLKIQRMVIKDVKNETIFNSDMIKEIFKVNDGDFQLITDSYLTKNYIIFSKKTEKLPFNKNVKEYKQYKSKAKLSFANQIYRTFDETINSKYNVKINEKVLNRIKNTL